MASLLPAARALGVRAPVPAPPRGRGLVVTEDACKRNLKKEKRTRNRINMRRFQKKTPRFGRGRFAEVETKVSDWESPFLTDENGNFLPVKARKQWTLDPSTNEWVEAVAEGSEEEGIEVVLGDDAQ